MARFWKHKSDIPLVRDHSGWYYSIEYYGIIHTFIDIEQFRQCSYELAHRKERWGRYTSPIWSKCGFELRMHRLRVLYIHLRHRGEIVNLYDQAYEQFYSERNNEQEAVS